VAQSHGIDRRTFFALAGGAAAAGLIHSEALAEDPASRLPLPAIWSFGQLMAFSGLDGPTDYTSGLVARTLEKPLGIEMMIPDQMALSFGTHAIGAVQLSNDSFEITTENGRTRGAFVDAFHLLCEGHIDIGALPQGLQMVSEGPFTLIGSKAHFNPKLMQLNIAELIASRQRWLKRQMAPSGLSEERSHTLSKALSVMKGQVCTPEGLLCHRWTTPDRWPHRDMWLWDSAFHAIGWRHVDPLLAREMIEAVFDGQQPDGRIPHQANPNRVSDITQPPVLALACQKLAGSPADLSWIERMYPRLCRYIEWDMEHRIAPGQGLAHWLTDDNPLSRCAESGMDNSPRFDTPATLNAIDLNSYLSMECRILSSFAEALGRTDEAKKWSDRNHDLNRLINERFWNEEAGFYFDEDSAEKRQTGVFAVTGFLPLLCGAPTRQQVQRLASHLKSPNTFATAVPIASAVMTPGMSRPHDMWRGPMWMNMNWLIAMGFELEGQRRIAQELREKSLRAVEHWYLKRGSIFEFYDEFEVTSPDELPRKGSLIQASASHQAVHDYGWTATLYVDLAFTTRL
jgi:putative isomerase